MSSTGRQVNPPHQGVVAPLPYTCVVVSQCLNVQCTEVQITTERRPIRYQMTITSDCWQRTTKRSIYAQHSIDTGCQFTQCCPNLVTMFRAICQPMQFAKCSAQLTNFLAKLYHSPNRNPNSNPEPDPNADLSFAPNLILILIVAKWRRAFCKLRRLTNGAQHTLALPALAALSLLHHRFNHQCRM